MMKNKLVLIFVLPLMVWGQETTNKFSMQEAIAYAQKHNYAIQNATDDIAAAENKVWETTTMGLPQINASADYQNFLKMPVSLIPAEFFGGQPGEFAEISFGTKQNINASATLTQLLFNGSYLVGLQSAKVYKIISENAKEKTEQATKEAVINAYSGVLLSQEGVIILEKNKAVLEKSLQQTKEIYKSGFAEEQDVEQLQLTLSEINNQLKNLKRLSDYNHNMLKYVMGIPIHNEIVLSQNLENLLSGTHLFDLENPFDYKNHIDYKIGENNIRANELFVKLEQSKALPSLNAYINYGVTANNEEFKHFSKDQKWFDSSLFGIQLNVPIFSSLKRTSRMQQAKIGLKKAHRAQEETTEKLKLQHQTAKLEYQNALDNYQTAIENVALAERIENKENIKFFEGVSTSFQLNSAQNQLYAKQQQYLQSIFNLISKKAVLDKILDNN